MVNNTLLIISLIGLSVYVPIFIMSSLRLYYDYKLIKNMVYFKFIEDVKNE